MAEKKTTKKTAKKKAVTKKTAAKKTTKKEVKQEGKLTEKKPVKKTTKKTTTKKTTKKSTTKKETTNEKPTKPEDAIKPETTDVAGDAPEQAEEKPAKPKKVKKEFIIPVEKIKNISPSRSPKTKTKPKFARQELSFRKKLDDKWRRPRGIDSKQKNEKRGKPKIPKIGYKNQKNTRGKIEDKTIVLVHNLLELEKIDEKSQIIIISQKIGRRKRNLIIQKANEKNIAIQNPRKGEA